MPRSDRRRGQTTALEYALVLALAALTITGLFSAAGDFVGGQQESVVRTELGVVGQQLASDVLAADRLVQSGATTDRLTINSSLPERVVGSQYAVSVDDAPDGHWINLSTSEPAVTVSVRVSTRTDVASTSVLGGELAVVYVSSSNELEVRP